MQTILYQAIGQALQGSAIQYIDLNKGQLNRPEETYPFPLPAVLVSFPNAPADHMTRYRLEQTFEIEVKVIMNEIQDTFIGATTLNNSLTRYDITNDVRNRLVFLSSEDFSAFHFTGEKEQFPKAETHVSLNFTSICHPKLSPYVSK